MTDVFISSRKDRENVSLPSSATRTAMRSVVVAAVFATSLIAQSAQARTASLAKQVSQADLQITPRAAPPTCPSSRRSATR